MQSSGDTAMVNLYSGLPVMFISLVWAGAAWASASFRA